MNSIKKGFGLPGVHRHDALPEGDRPPAVREVLQGVGEVAPLLLRDTYEQLQCTRWERAYTWVNRFSSSATLRDSRPGAYTAPSLPTRF